LGRLHTNKAFDTALEVLTRLPEAYLWIAGDGKLDQALKEQAGRLGLSPRVRFLGWRDDTPALLAAADAFLCSSRHEPLGNIVLDAWAHNVPVIAAASQGPSQLITDGETGLLAPVDDADALAAQMKRVLSDDDLARNLASSGQERFQMKFSVDPVVSAYQEFFDKVKNLR